MPDRPGIREGIAQGMYLFQPAEDAIALLGGDLPTGPRPQLLGSGPIVNEALRAQELLLRDYGVASDVWSVTSYNELRREALDCERWNWLHPTEPPRVPFVSRMLGPEPTLVVGATDYLKSLPDSIAKWVGAPLVSLGTDGFGRSGTRAELRDFFEVDARHIAFATLSALVRSEAVAGSVARQAMNDLGINPERPEPGHALGSAGAVAPDRRRTTRRLPLATGPPRATGRATAWSRVGELRASTASPR